MKRLSKHMLAALMMVGAAQTATANEVVDAVSEGCVACTCEEARCLCNDLEVQKSANIIQMSVLSDLQNVIATSPRVMVKFFFGDKCSSCAAGRLFTKLARESTDDTIFIAFNVVDSKDAVTTEYGISQFPSIVLFTNGEKDTVVYGG